MKKIGAIMLFILSACVLQACKSKATDNNGADSASQDTLTTLNLAVDKDDSQFAVEAAYRCMAEIALGKLAMQNGRSKKVKNFGAMMIKDRSKINNRLLSIAIAKKVTLPVMLDTAAKKEIAALSGKSGTDFDKAYISRMIIDHVKAVNTFTEASKKVQDPDLQSFAIKTLPVLQKHLDDINGIHDSMGK